MLFAFCCRPQLKVFSGNHLASTSREAIFVAKTGQKLSPNMPEAVAGANNPIISIRVGRLSETIAKPGSLPTLGFSVCPPGKRNYSAGTGLRGRGRRYSVRITLSDRVSRLAMVLPLRHGSRVRSTRCLPCSGIQGLISRRNVPMPRGKLWLLRRCTRRHDSHTLPTSTPASR